MNKKCTNGHEMVGIDLPQFTEIVWYCLVEDCAGIEVFDD